MGLQARARTKSNSSSSRVLCGMVRKGHTHTSLKLELPSGTHTCPERCVVHPVLVVRGESQTHRLCFLKDFYPSWSRDLLVALGHRQVPGCCFSDSFTARGALTIGIACIHVSPAWVMGRRPYLSQYRASPCIMSASRLIWRGGAFADSA